MTPYFLGIDVSKHTNVGCLVDSPGATLGVTSVANTLTGSQTFETWLVAQAQHRQIEQLAIATEATSLYDFHLVEFLSQSEALAPYHPVIYRFNPRPVKAFKASLKLRDTTDPTDAYATAEYLRFHQGHAQPYRCQQAHLSLQRLTRFRHPLVQQLTREKSYFLTHLFLHFSTLDKGQPFSDLFGATASAVIDEFMTPDEIATASPDALLQFVIQRSKNRFAEPERLVEELQRVARASYRLTPALADSVHHVLCLTLATIRALTASLKTLNATITKELASFPNTLTSIPGIGPLYAAGIFAELGDIQAFPSHAQVAKLAGLIWPRTQSGEFEAEDRRMDKQANAYLRYYLIEAADSLRRHNPEYRAYYQKKYREGTKHQHKRALVLTARKFVRLVYALLTKNVLYQPAHPAPRA
jgi:transposase